MGSRGPQPTGRREKAEHIGLKVPSEMKQRLIAVVNRKKAAEPTLPLSYGLSEYIRELLAAHLAEVAAPPKAPSAQPEEAGHQNLKAAPVRRRRKEG